MDRVDVVWRIGVLGPKVFAMEAAGQQGNISNQTEVIKLGFQGGETFKEDRDFISSERLGGEVNDRVCWIDRLGVSFWKGG